MRRKCSGGPKARPSDRCVDLDISSFYNRCGLAGTLSGQRGGHLTIDYSELTPGQSVSRRSYLLDREMIADYMSAVQDGSGHLSSRDGTTLAPPMSIAALSVGGVVKDLQIPGGSLHVGQEIDFVRAVPLGESLSCEVTVKQNSVRGGWRFMVLESEVRDSEGRNVMSGRSTVLVPVPEDASPKASS